MISNTATGTIPGYTVTDTGLAIIELEIMLAPPKLGVVTDILGLATAGARLCKWVDINAVEYKPPQLATTNGGYQLTWAEPPYPWLEVVPDLVEKGVGGVPAIGETFTVDVMIMQLGAAWQVTNVTFELAFNDTFLEVIDIDPGWDSGEFFDSGVYASTIWKSMTPSSSPIFFMGNITGGIPPGPYPSGDLVVASIEFNVTAQATAPAGAYECDLDLQNIGLEDPWDAAIPSAAEEDGYVIVYPYLPLAPPHLAVDPVTTTLGPCYAIGQEFDVDIRIENVSWQWFLVGIQFRLSFDDALIEGVSVTEGPFLGLFTANKTGTFFISYIESNGLYGPNILVGALLLPNSTGYWVEPFPDGSGVIATIRFRAVYQLYGFTNCSALDFIDIKMIDKDGAVIPTDLVPDVNGTYCITGENLPGRVIDIYTQYPAPYGGQGLDQPSDMFWPQKEVILCANLTYNCWPVQSKPVDFIVKDPSGAIWTVLQGITDEVGVACVSFRIPWPCEDPDLLFGVWCVKAQTDLYCEEVNDTVCFHYDWVVNVESVTTDKWQYAHCETVTITVVYSSHMQQEHEIAMDVTVHDEVNVPFGTVHVVSTIGGACYCQAKIYEEEVQLHVVKWAAAGLATAYVNFRHKHDGQWTPAGLQATVNFFIMPY
jgi:hypothetical protein